MQLHLGCGPNILEGWVNVDIASDDPRVVTADVSALEDIAGEQSVTRIYASHVFEHIRRARQVAVLSHWQTRLVPGGACYLSVPDFEYIVGQYLQARDADEPWWTGEIIRPLLGGSDYGDEEAFNRHHSLFDFRHMESLMQRAGFANIRRYDPRGLDFEPNDNSLRALSLNVVGIRP